MPTPLPKNRLFPLTAEDKTRLQNLAPLFDIHFRKMDEQTCVLRTMAGAGALELKLPASLAYRRLLSELCEKTVPWIPFHLKESCRDSLLGRSDANLARVAVLYARDRKATRARAAISLCLL
ncbi:hypothetical protein [Polaromonas naphthalenivorans]|nr:hypothetical protein [Polaromonas naphthalenivorans]